MADTLLDPAWVEQGAGGGRRVAEAAGGSFKDIVKLNIFLTDLSHFAKVNEVYKNVPTEVVYLLGLKDDQWRVRDIVLDDVSTADGYARSFQTVVRKRGFDALMESLTRKLDSMSS